MGTDISGVARAVVEPFEGCVPLDRALVSFCRRPHPAILESSLRTEGCAPYTILACDPVRVVSIPQNASRSPLDRVEEALTLPIDMEPCSAPPFVGGWIGFISYQAGLAAEGIRLAPGPDPALPAARFALYDAVAVFDHAEERWLLAALDWPSGFAGHRPPARARLAGLKLRLQQAATHDAPTDEIAESGTVLANMTHEEYLAKVRRIQRYIEAGDTYQVNLTQRFTTRTALSPEALYLRLRRITPSPYAAFLKWDDLAILSASPELFLDLRDGDVVTRPIKGTRPRGAHPAEDAALRRALMGSEKDRAELNMIVDLLRNDIGRVCTPGSVCVRSAGDIEAHPNVFHRVATIEGRLQPGKSWADLLRATFPGGSVTGVPKIRAMQIISELEPTTRGPYCGAIGWIGLDGSMQLNLAIRTMVQVKDTVHLYTGGAIVADSDPQEEYDETIAKAGGMLRAVGCRAPERSVDPSAIVDTPRCRLRVANAVEEASIT